MDEIKNIIVGDPETGQSVIMPHNNNKLKTLLVFWVHVGTMPPFKAEAYVERMKNGLKGLHKPEDDFAMIFVASRIRETQIQVINL